MLRHKPASTEQGFTLVELLVVISVVAVMVVSFGSFFTNYLILYTKYQKDETNFTELASQSQRIADVLRGLTDITAETANSITIYAYFSPVDSYVSQVTYYLNGTSTAVMADVTPMTANPPVGTLLTAQKKTYTIISNYYHPTNGTLFTYYDASGTALTFPIADEHTITQIQVNLAEPATHTANGQTLTTSVGLRNRKINL